MANRLLFKLISFLSTTLRYVLSLLSFLFFSFSCTPTEPKFINEELQLHLEDVSCIEAWVTLNTGKIKLPAEIAIYKNNTQIKNILCYGDTLLYIDSLLPSQTYTIQALLKEQGGNQLSVTSNKITVTTMDTTSSNFTWETFTFGDVGSSVLYDVAIINENNIWAVGRILIADTSVNGYKTYNAVHWDGHSWKLKKIGNQGGWTCRTVFAFSENDVWFDGVIKWDGSKYTVHKNSWPLLPNGDGWQINKMWGSSSNDLYAVGNGGNIAHWNGNKWTKIESGTGLNINDIWGDYNEKKGEWEILAVASNKFFNEGNYLLMIDGSFTKQINNAGLSWSISSIWHKTNRKYLIGGDGLFFKKTLYENWNKDTKFIPIYKDRIRGNNINDIVVSGSNGLLSHYNGINWRHFLNNELPFYSGRLLSVDIKNDVIVAVGWKETQSIINIGIR